jgi:hypothetical protein
MLLYIISALDRVYITIWVGQRSDDYEQLFFYKLTEFKTFEVL